MKKRIAVITGGEASEVGISLKSADVVCRHLNRTKYEVYQVLIEGNDWYVTDGQNQRQKIDKNDFSFGSGTQKIQFDGVFIAIHGTPAEDGKLQGYFDLLKIPYSCCGVLAAALSFNKQVTKEYLSPLGIKTARAVLLRKNEAADAAYEIPLPVFVKPNKNGSSYGASKVSRREDLLPAIKNGFQYDDELLVEEYIAGTEVTCGVITRNGKVTPLPLTEIRSKSDFFDYRAKYEGQSQEITPAEISDDLTVSIQKTSVFIYQKLGFKGMCRIDYIIRNGEYYLLEVNSIPGLSEESIVPKQAAAMGISLEELFDLTLEEAMSAPSQASGQ